jgi:hypothetical protein
MKNNIFPTLFCLLTCWACENKPQGTEAGYPDNWALALSLADHYGLKDSLNNSAMQLSPDMAGTMIRRNPHIYLDYKDGAITFINAKEDNGTHPDKRLDR